jgi:hypothetical protein
LDTIDSHTINTLTQFDWTKLILKSILPSLITVKAFIDPTINALTNQNQNPNEK